MAEFSVFISYSHADEWLKDELIRHLSALKRNGIVDVWHDRLIPAGKVLDEEIDRRVASSDIFLLLISTEFIYSDYCFSQEYQTALSRHDLGEAVVVPVIVRDCDWDVGRLKTLNALPRDGTPVTRNAPSRLDGQARDQAWVDVVAGLKLVVQDLKKRNSAPKLRQEYADALYKVETIRHPMVPQLDERLIFVDPSLYFENEQRTVASFEHFCDLALSSDATVITGGDRSGKSLIAKALQCCFDHAETPAVLINGAKIRNANVLELIEAEFLKQYEIGTFPRRKCSVIIDDFDECRLGDRVKERMIRSIFGTYGKCVLFSFSSAPSVLLAPSDLPDPSIFKIEAVTDDKLHHLVRKWRQVGLDDVDAIDERIVLATYERLQVVFHQTELEKTPHSAVTFLELLDSATGADIAFSSLAACYDALMVNRLGRCGVSWQSFDEAKNFLSLVAYKAYAENGAAFLSRAGFASCLDVFEHSYLSSGSRLRETAIGPFLREDGERVAFYEEYLWYFLVARYVARSLRVEDCAKYADFVQKCAENIFQKKYANIIIYLAYFTDDGLVISSLLKIVDGLFSGADGWILSDDTRDLMLGLRPPDQLLLESRVDVTENRIALLKEKAPDIIKNAEAVVARYTLPFLSSEIGDSEFMESIEENGINTDSYMESVNALLRTHSVIGQILGARTGTFTAKFVSDCITRMVEASGRYATLNHAIATVLLYDKETALEEVDRALDGEALSIEEKYQKVMRIFSFWSVLLSQAGLARYLCQEHSIRALEKLAEEYEDGALRTEEGNVPFNFTSVLVIARLFYTGAINRGDVERCLETYGDKSALMSLLRVSFHMYAYYMPMTISDKQWISEKLHMPLKKIEMQRMRASGLPKKVATAS